MLQVDGNETQEHLQGKIHTFHRASCNLLWQILQLPRLFAQTQELPLQYHTEVNQPGAYSNQI